MVFLSGVIIFSGHTINVYSTCGLILWYTGLFCYINDIIIKAENPGAFDILLTVKMKGFKEFSK